MPPLQTLHILNKSPGHSRHQLCLASLGINDGLLLIENGVLATTKYVEAHNGRWFALTPDMEARGLKAQPGVQAASFADMVELATSAEKVVSW